MTNALVRFERASTQIVARASAQTDHEPVDALVEIIQAKAQFQASAAVLEAADEMVHAVIDIRV